MICKLFLNSCLQPISCCYWQDLQGILFRMEDSRMNTALTLVNRKSNKYSCTHSGRSSLAETLPAGCKLMIKNKFPPISLHFFKIKELQWIASGKHLQCVLVSADSLGANCYSHSVKSALVCYRTTHLMTSKLNENSCACSMTNLPI